MASEHPSGLRVTFSDDVYMRRDIIPLHTTTLSITVTTCSFLKLEFIQAHTHCILCLCQWPSGIITYFGNTSYLLRSLVEGCSFQSIRLFINLGGSLISNISLPKIWYSFKYPLDFKSQKAASAFSAITGDWKKRKRAKESKPSFGSLDSSDVWYMIVDVYCHFDLLLVWIWNLNYIFSAKTDVPLKVNWFSERLKKCSEKSSSVLNQWRMMTNEVWISIEDARVLFSGQKHGRADLQPTRYSDLKIMLRLCYVCSTAFYFSLFVNLSIIFRCM